MNKKLTLLLVIAMLCSYRTQVYSQNESDESSLLKVEDGISFKKDSLFLLNLRFRMQNRFGYFETLDNVNEPGFEARVRRLRLRFDGYLYSPKLSYYIQLSFSRGDQDIVQGFAPNIVRDAMIYYKPSKTIYFGFGQSKLPGNRQRVISSGNIQMPDRSIANQVFNIDRDFGFFAYQTYDLSGTNINIKSAITSGEGRNSIFSNSGLSYTGRFEFLPMGSFLNKGDYSEGDLEYEIKPKLSLAATYSYNHKAVRSGGQLGFLLDTPIDIQTIVFDMMFKYKGWAILGEYFDRQIYNWSAESESITGVNYGSAYNIQLSKTFKNRFELSARFAQLQTANEQLPNLKTKAIGISKYINGHRVKIQTYFGLDDRSQTLDNFELKNRFTTFFQVEFGI